MSSDLLFSILPREGKVPIAHDELRVEKVLKESALRQLSDEEQELHLEERETRQQQQQSRSKKKSPEADSENESKKDAPQTEDSDKPNKGFKHLDIYV